MSIHCRHAQSLCPGLRLNSAFCLLMLGLSFPLHANTTESSTRADHTLFAQHQGEMHWELHSNDASLAHIQALQAKGAHQEALLTLQRMEQQVRMEEGIHSLAQVPLIEHSLVSLRALSQYTQVQERLQRLLQLQQRQHGHDAIETVPALMALADEARERFELFSAGEDDDQPSRSSTHREQRALQALDEAQRYFVESINLLTAAKAFDHPLLIPLEERLLDTYYLQAWHGPARLGREESTLQRSARDLSEDNLLQLTFLGGKHAHNRILAYLRHQPDTPVATYASALAARGDWYMLFGHKNEAFQSYADAEEMLRESNAPRDLVMAILQPAHALSAAPGTHFDRLHEDSEVAASPHYIDVAFHINRFGQPTKLRRLGRSPDTSPALATALLKQARQSRFRPHISGGKAVSSDEVRLRYYANEAMVRRW